MSRIVFLFSVTLFASACTTRSSQEEAGDDGSEVSGQGMVCSDEAKQNCRLVGSASDRDLKAAKAKIKGHPGVTAKDYQTFLYNLADTGNKICAAGSWVTGGVAAACWLASSIDAETKVPVPNPLCVPIQVIATSAAARAWICEQAFTFSKKVSSGEPKNK